MLLSVDPATHKRCKSVIVMFMSFVHGRLPGSRCNPDHDFTDAELTAVTPLDVCRFGAEFPSPDANPIATWHETIAIDKKAISFLCLIEGWVP